MREENNITDLRKAAEMALETLVKQHEWMIANDGMFQIPSRKAIQALRQALAQPEQEPVAWIRKNGFRFNENLEPKDGSEVPLYTAPSKREWQGLTNDEIYYFVRNAESYLECAKGIEAKLKEKNT